MVGENASTEWRILVPSANETGPVDFRYAGASEYLDERMRCCTHGDISSRSDKGADQRDRAGVDGLSHSLEPTLSADSKQAYQGIDKASAGQRVRVDLVVEGGDLGGDGSDVGLDLGDGALPEWVGGNERRGGEEEHEGRLDLYHCE